MDHFGFFETRIVKKLSSQSYVGNFCLKFVKDMCLTNTKEWCAIMEKHGYNNRFTNTSDYLTIVFNKIKNTIITETSDNMLKDAVKLANSPVYKAKVNFRIKIIKERTI